MYIGRNSHRISFSYIKQEIVHEGSHCFKPCALRFILRMRLHFTHSGAAFCDWTQKKKKRSRIYTSGVSFGKPEWKDRHMTSFFSGRASIRQKSPWATLYEIQIRKSEGGPKWGIWNLVHQLIVPWIDGERVEERCHVLACGEWSNRLWNEFD